MAAESHASTISALAPCPIRLSISANCFCADDCASVETYLSPLAAIAAFIAASSVFHRSSWKFDQETPMILPLATASPPNETDNAPANRAAANRPITSSRRRQTQTPRRSPRSFENTIFNRMWLRAHRPYFRGTRTHHERERQIRARHATIANNVVVCSPPSLYSWPRRLLRRNRNDVRYCRIFEYPRRRVSSRRGTNFGRHES